MRISVEISYYPLQEQYIPPIVNFIDRLNTHKNINVKTSGISTHVFGEYSDVMSILTAEIEKSFEVPHSIFVLKILNSDRSDY